jgi:hypothetical protein
LRPESSEHILAWIRIAGVDPRCAEQEGMAANTMTREIPARQKFSGPDTSRCKVTTIGVNMYAECPYSGPNECPYALPFGYGFLCQHPQFNEFLRKETGAGSKYAS